MAKGTSRALISKTAPATVVATDSPTATEAPTSTFKELGGTNFIAFNRMLIHQAAALYTSSRAQRETDDRYDGAIAAMASLAPRDAQEGMIAAQMFGLHSAAMDCLRRSAFEGQTFEAREMNLV